MVSYVREIAKRVCEMGPFNRGVRGWRTRRDRRRRGPSGGERAGALDAGKKRRIRHSRVRGPCLLSETLAGLHEPPRVIACALATGYYGDRSSEALSEERNTGSNFLAGVCREWEGAADPVREVGMRVVHTRFGIVLSPKSEVLGATLPVFKLGGGRIGDGRQDWPWVTIDDVVGAIFHVLGTEALEGPVNVAVSHPPTNAEYARVLGRVLDRRTVFSLPAQVARLALGQVADELLLASQRVEPAKLNETGYQFRYPELEGALRHLLGR